MCSTFWNFSENVHLKRFSSHNFETFSSPHVATPPISRLPGQTCPLTPGQCQLMQTFAKIRSFHNLNFEAASSIRMAHRFLFALGCAFILNNLISQWFVLPEVAPNFLILFFHGNYFVPTAWQSIWGRSTGNVTISILELSGWSKSSNIELAWVMLNSHAE